MTPKELKKAREKLKLSQRRLGEELDRCERWVFSRECGETEIDKLAHYAMKWLLHCENIKRK